MFSRVSRRYEQFTDPGYRSVTMLLFSLPLWFHLCFSPTFLLLLLAGPWVHGQGIVSPCVANGAHGHTVWIQIIPGARGSSTNDDSVESSHQLRFLGSERRRYLLHGVIAYHYCWHSCRFLLLLRGSPLGRLHRCRCLIMPEASNQQPTRGRAGRSTLQRGFFSIAGPHMGTFFFPSMLFV